MLDDEPEYRLCRACDIAILTWCFVVVILEVWIGLLGFVPRPGTDLLGNASKASIF
jgi:hypothetical protein